MSETASVARAKVPKDRNPASCELQQTCFNQMMDFPCAACLSSAGKLQLRAGKVSHNEARGTSHAFGKGELHLGIASTRQF